MYLYVCNPRTRGIHQCSMEYIALMVPCGTLMCHDKMKKNKLMHLCCCADTKQL